MQLKKHLRLGTAIIAFALPLIANASLITHNNTDQDSAVTVTSGAFKGQCTGTAPGKLRTVTMRNTTSSVDWQNVQGLCLASGNICTADIHMTANCSDPAVATASLNLSTAQITVTANLMPSVYNIHASGSELFLDKA